MRDEWLEPEEDRRPIIAICEQCGQDIRGEDAGNYGDPYYEFEGIYLHEDCLLDWMRQFKHGG